MERRENDYKKYVTDSLYLLGGFNMRYSEMVQNRQRYIPRKEETAEEITSRIKSKLQAMSEG